MKGYETSCCPVRTTRSEPGSYLFLEQWVHLGETLFFVWLFLGITRWLVDEKLDRVRGDYSDVMWIGAQEHRLLCNVHTGSLSVPIRGRRSSVSTQFTDPLIFLIDIFTNNYTPSSRLAAAILQKYYFIHLLSSEHKFSPIFLWSCLKWQHLH